MYGVGSYIEPVHSDTITAGPARLLSASQLREEVGLGSDTSSDAALTEAINAATEYAGKFLGYSPAPATRTDFYTDFWPMMRLSYAPQQDFALTIAWQDADFEWQDFIELVNPITTLDSEGRAKFDETGDRMIVLTEDGMNAAGELELNRMVNSPVRIAYEEAGPALDATNAIKIGVRKLAYALFSQQDTETQMSAMRDMELMLGRFQVRGGML